MLREALQWYFKCHDHYLDLLIEDANSEHGVEGLEFAKHLMDEARAEVRFVIALLYPE